jgi:hypothetical protein
MRRASGPVFIFCASGHIFGGAESIGSCFHVLRCRTRFWRFPGRRVPFSCFAFLESFLAVPWASGPVFMFCAPGLFFGGTEGFGSRFHILHARTRFRRYRGCRVLFSCLALPDRFPTVPRMSGPVFMFCAPGYFFDGIEGVLSHFHFLRSRTRFQFCGGRRVPFSCFALPDTFSIVRRASGPVFMFCAPGLIFGGTEGVGSRFHFLRARTHFRRYRGRPVLFLFCAPRTFFLAVQRA